VGFGFEVELFISLDECRAIEAKAFIVLKNNTSTLSVTDPHL